MFTYYIQYGGDPYEQYDSKGQTDFDHFMSVFDDFPWMEELGKANEKPQGSSPTLSVKNGMAETDFWVSISGDGQSHGYLLGYIFVTTKKRWLGFGSAKRIRWLEIYLTRNMPAVKYYFRLFFENKYDQLLTEIRKLERFTALETRN